MWELCICRHCLAVLPSNLGFLIVWHLWNIALPQFCCRTGKKLRGEYTEEMPFYLAARPSLRTPFSYSPLITVRKSGKTNERSLPEGSYVVFNRVILVTWLWTCESSILLKGSIEKTVDEFCFHSCSAADPCWPIKGSEGGPRDDMKLRDGLREWKQIWENLAPLLKLTNYAW